MIRTYLYVTIIIFTNITNYYYDNLLIVNNYNLIFLFNLLRL